MANLGSALTKASSLHPIYLQCLYKDVEIGRDSWMNTDIGKSRVWGEYLRLLHYGEKGDILKLDVEL